MSMQKDKFSARLHQLETLYQNIQEHSGHEIDELIDMYEKGIRIAVSLEKELQSYEKKIHKIMANTPTATETNNVLHEETEEENTETIAESSRIKKTHKTTSKAVDIFSEDDT